MRISAWSSDVCSSDLVPVFGRHRVDAVALVVGGIVHQDGDRAERAAHLADRDAQRFDVGDIALHEARPRVAFLGQRLDESRGARLRSEEHTSELQSLMRISYAVFCLKKKTNKTKNTHKIQTSK